MCHCPENLRIRYTSSIMPRRELLTSSERLELLTFPTDEGELIRLYTLTKADMAFARQHRGNHNRLGIAVLMSYVRYPGRVLAGVGAHQSHRRLHLAHQ